jgi:hypothetical protein
VRDAKSSVFTGVSGKAPWLEHIIFSHVLYQLSYLGNLRAGRRAAVYRGWVSACPDTRPGGAAMGVATDPDRSHR